MTSTALPTRTTRLPALALVAFTLCFVLVVYTLLHEVGHALVGLFFGQTWTALDVNLLALRAHVGLVGELTAAQRALQSMTGAALPLLAWFIFISAAPRRSSYLVELLKCLATVAVLSSLLAWIILPVLYRLGQAPVDDVSNFLGAAGMEPLLLSFGALAIWVIGWLWFGARIQTVRGEVTLLTRPGRATVFTGLREPFLVMTALLIICSGAIILLSSLLNPLAPPQGYQAVAHLDLADHARTHETLWQMALDRPAEVGVYAVVQGIDTPYFDLRLTGSDGFDAVILHGEDYTADRDRATWSRALPPGRYQLVVTSQQTPGRVAVYVKDR